MPHQVKPEHWIELNLVITLAEACRLYKLHRSVLTYAIDSNNVAAVRVGHTVIISKRSIESYFFRSVQS